MKTNSMPDPFRGCRFTITWLIAVFALVVVSFGALIARRR